MSSRSESFRRFCPSMTTSPAVGSMRRERQRTTVDFPEPESPMITKISPLATSKETSHAAGTWPEALSLSIASSASPLAPSACLRVSGALGPNTFHSDRQLKLGLAIRSSPDALSTLLLFAPDGQQVAGQWRLLVPPLR